MYLPSLSVPPLPLCKLVSSRPSRPVGRPRAWQVHPPPRPRSLLWRGLGEGKLGRLGEEHYWLSPIGKAVILPIWKILAQPNFKQPSDCKEANCFLMQDFSLKAGTWNVGDRSENGDLEPGAGQDRGPCRWQPRPAKVMMTILVMIITMVIQQADRTWVCQGYYRRADKSVALHLKALVDNFYYR